jgi:hypothetical protein
VDFISLLATFTEVVVGGGGGGVETEVVVAPDALPWRQQQHLYPDRSKHECQGERAFNNNGETLKAIIPENNSI